MAVGCGRRDADLAETDRAGEAGRIVHQIAHTGGLADRLQDAGVDVTDDAVHGTKHRLQNAAVARKVQAAISAEEAAQSRQAGLAGRRRGAATAAIRAAATAPGIPSRRPLRTLAIRSMAPLPEPSF